MDQKDCFKKIITIIKITITVKTVHKQEVIKI